MSRHTQPHHRTKAKFNIWAVATVLALVLVACGGAVVADTTAVATTTTTTEAPTTTEPPTTTTQAATTTTVDIVEAAGSYYLEIVAPSNCTISAISVAETALADSEGLFHEEDWDQMQDEVFPLYLAHADEQQKFIVALAAYDWPPFVQVEVDTLTGELTALIDYWHGLAETSSFDAWNGFASDVTYDAPAQIRSKLGLPDSPPVDQLC